MTSEAARVGQQPRRDVMAVMAYADWQLRHPANHFMREKAGNSPREALWSPAI
jgi:hypothetical protein